jgi:hypothetical protein
VAPIITHAASAFTSSIVNEKPAANTSKLYTTASITTSIILKSRVNTNV